MAPGKSSHAQTMLKRKFELLDPDILECPICSEDLAPPVYQCRTDHIMCAGCWEKINHKNCPSCRKQIGNTHCIAVEKILESLLVSCKNTLNGCMEMLRYTKIAEHESTLCEYQPFNCPFHVHLDSVKTQGCDIRKGDEWIRIFLPVPESAHGLGNCEFQGQLDIGEMPQLDIRLWNY